MTYAPDLPKELRRTVEKTLSARFERYVSISEVHNFPYSCVFRCSLTGLPEDKDTTLPRMVILRLPRTSGGRKGPALLQNEHSALAYLTELGCELTPRVLGVSADASFLITEDLGDAPSLLDVLLGNDPMAAERSVLAFARAFAGLHTRTLSLTIPPAEPRMVTTTAPTVTESWQEVRKAVAQTGLLQPDDEVDHDVASVLRTLANPGVFRVLSSGDPSVVNCKITDTGVRFFDFEEACFRHVFSDIVSLRYFYPTGGPAWLLPAEVSARMEREYRDEWERFGAAALTDSEYNTGVAVAATAWTILRLARLQGVETGPDRDPWLLLPTDWSGPVPVRSRRRQLVSILETCIDSLRRANTLSSFAGWCERITIALQSRWKESAEELPLYPAFR